MNMYRKAYRSTIESQRGMSLFELLIVVAIISIVGAIALLNSQSLRDTYNTRAAARQIFGDMQMARLSAIKQGTPWAICFNGNPTFNAYTVGNSRGPDNLLCTADDGIPVNPAPPSNYFRTTLLGGNFATLTFNQTFGGTSVIFNPNGTATCANAVCGNVAIGALTRPVPLTVIVNPNTGNIRIP